MTNADVVKMAKAGLSEAVIIAAIQGAGKASFDTDPQTLIALKGEGVGEPVIVALLNRSSATSIAPAASGTGALPAPRDLGDPGTPRRGGIYVDAGAESARLQALDTQPLAETETRRGMYGKGSTVVVLRPARSSSRVPAAPSFYFYFGPEGTDTGQPGAFVADVTTPSEFILARMKAKSDHRELVLSKTGTAWFTPGKTKSGVQQDDRIETRVEKVAPGVFRVTPKHPLPPGEYCFVYSVFATALMPMPGLKAFEFGVDAGTASR